MRKTRGSVLVADSSAKGREDILQSLLMVDADLSILQADSPATLGTILSNTTIDILFIGERFSGMDGLDVIEQLGPLRHSSLTILLADHFSAATLERSRKLGLYDCIQTPLKESDLQRILLRRDAQLNKLSALVIDSQPATRRIIFKLLSDCRFRLMISEAETGPLAVSLSKAIPYHILLVDPETEGWQGSDMAKKIATRQPQCQIVLMSAGDETAILAQHGDAEVTGFIKKPFYPDDLERLMHQLLNIPPSNLLNKNFFEEQTPPPSALSNIPSPLSGHGEAEQSAEGYREIVWL